MATRGIVLLLAGLATAHEDITLDGSGTTNPSKFYWEVMSLFEARTKPRVMMSYRAVGSSTGIYEFLGAENGFTPYNDFGSGDVPLTAENYADITAEGIEVMHVPFSLGAMSFFHNVPGAVGGLNMTACLLADIFNRDVTEWDDSEIMDLNPNLDVPAGEPILVYRRVSGSSTTNGITTYLNAACPDKWPEDQVGSSITWPEGTLEAEGSGGMSAGISGSLYTIGYIDSGHGHDDGLFEIELENADGTRQSSLEAQENGGIQEAAAQALARDVVPSDPLADFSAVSLHNMPGTYTWPIVAISYIFVRKDQTGKGETGALLKAFVDFVIGEEGQGMLSDYNFVGVPESVLEVAQSASNMIDLDPSVQTWSVETDTARGTGQLDYVISGKRRSHFEYAIGELEAETAGQADIDALNAQIEAMSAELAEVKGNQCGCDDDDNDAVKEDARNAMIIAIIALALAFIGLLLTCYAMSKASSAMKAVRDSGAVGVQKGGDV